MRADLPGCLAPVPAYATLLIPYDPLRLSADEAAAAVHRYSPGPPTCPPPISMPHSIRRPPTLTEIPMRYGGPGGPDLEEVAALHRRTPEEIVTLHTGTVYRVYMLGFAPALPTWGRSRPIW